MRPFPRRWSVSEVLLLLTIGVAIAVPVPEQGAGEVEGEAISLVDVSDESRIAWYKQQGLEPVQVQKTQLLSEVHPDAHVLRSGQAGIVAGKTPSGESAGTPSFKPLPSTTQSGPHGHEGVEPPRERTQVDNLDFSAGDRERASQMHVAGQSRGSPASVGNVSPSLDYRTRRRRGALRGGKKGQFAGMGTVGLGLGATPRGETSPGGVASISAQPAARDGNSAKAIVPSKKDVPSPSETISSGGQGSLFISGPATTLGS